MSQDTPAMDYAGPAFSEIALQAGRAGHDPSQPPKRLDDLVTRAVTRQLLSACIVVPALLWGVYAIGVHLRWYSAEFGLIFFACAVTAATGVIVWFNLMKLSRVEAQKAETQEQLKRAKETAEAANRFKSMFFANISHEIRTPLTAINGFAELLLNSERTEQERRADAQVIRRNGEHLLTLINDILDLSRIEAGKMSVDRVLCRPAAIVAEVCSMLRPRAVEKGLTLDVKFKGEIPKMILTDPTRLRQVFINLIANAIKFTKQGGVSLTVSVEPTMYVENPLLQVAITDTGIGIAPEQQATLFRPFVQGDASITRQYGGSGLGLAISQHFVRALGGEITLASESGRGSTFTVTVGTGSLVGAELDEHPDQAAGEQENFAGPRVRIEGSVLVAEDGIDNQGLISAKLRETGLQVEIVSNGQIACEKALAAAAADKAYDLILMDVQMPVMDGFAATLHLRSKGYRGPIIALTANAMERDRAKCLSAGCNDFVTKPIKMAKLFKAIGRYLKIAEATQKSATAQDAAAAATRAAAVEKFYQQLPLELAQIEQAIEREDRVRFKEIAQLLLGMAAAAGLKDLAPQVARLFQAADGERSWPDLRQAANEFAAECRPKSQRQAA